MIEVPVYFPETVILTDFRENPDTEVAIKAWARFLYARAPYMVWRAIIPDNDGPTGEAWWLIEEMRRLESAILSHCGRCGKEIVHDAAEVCWWCHGDLCIGCWEKFGHCGHPEADELNERTRAWYAEHEQEARG